MKLIPSNRPFDAVVVGELLVHLCSAIVQQNWKNAVLFEKRLGGNAGVLSKFLSVLGNRTALISSVGTDVFGDELISDLTKYEVDIQYVTKNTKFSTGAIVGLNTNDPHLQIVHRGADKQIKASQVEDALLEQTSVFHTSLFALSELPAREVILEAAYRASVWRCAVSFDINFSLNMLSMQSIAWEIIERFCATGAIVKITEAEAKLLYGQSDIRAQTVFSNLHKFGAKLVCIVLQEGGCLLSFESGKQQFELLDNLATPLFYGYDLVFWSGFLTSLIDGNEILTSAKFGLAVAQNFQQQQGVFGQNFDKFQLYKSIKK
ncbi:MAG: carbohydrate kinase family protein [Saprospiraceae bacterium]|nr:carbohydrate kinase family protein [Saprospiraceae bacterium]